MGGIDLGGELTDHRGHQYHRQSRSEENFLDGVGEAEDTTSRQRRTAQVDDEDAYDDHELPSINVSIQIVPPVCQQYLFVSGWMGIPVDQVIDDPDEADERGLLSFHHPQPDDGSAQDANGEPGGDVPRQFCTLIENEGDGDDDGK